MKKYTVEMSYGSNITVEIEAEDVSSAITQAKQAVQTDIDIDCSGRVVEFSGFQFEEVTYVE